MNLALRQCKVVYHRNLRQTSDFEKKLFKGKAIISASVRDVFASRIRESFAEQATFYAYDRSLRGRFITAGFSYGFGKGEAMEYNVGRRR